MLRISIVSLVCVFSITTWAQNPRGQFWFAAGATREFKHHLEVGVGSNLRLNQFGQLRTLYQEASLKYTRFDWFRPSVEYRLITSYDQRRNYAISNRVNINLNFRYSWQDFKFGTRFRYQFALGGMATTGGDLDQALRIKPYVSYGKKKALVKPEVSVEFFYNPANEPMGHRFNRVRYGFTLDFNLPKSNDLSLTYYYGSRFNNKIPYKEHILSLEYGFEWKPKKKKKSDSKKETDSDPEID